MRGTGTSWIVIAMLLAVACNNGGGGSGPCGALSMCCSASSTGGLDNCRRLVSANDAMACTNYLEAERLQGRCTMVGTGTDAGPASASCMAAITCCNAFRQTPGADPMMQQTAETCAALAALDDSTCSSLRDSFAAIAMQQGVTVAACQ
jgi:hypothetical protein